MNKKIILFALDNFNLYDMYFQPDAVVCHSHLDTNKAIKDNSSKILTYDLSNLCFDLEKDFGYEIYIGYQGYMHKFYMGMGTKDGKELRYGHNLLRLLLGHALDADLGIN